MFGVYFHIPFCRKACHYCDFHFSTSLRLKDDMMNAMASETEIALASFPHHTVATIYFGGGTPGLMEPDDIARLIEAVRKEREVREDAEITLEVNPDDVNPEKARAWLKAGVNRLSIGIQSFRDSDLFWMNRSHDGDAARQSVRILREAGFQNMTADLIYGLPDLDAEAWADNIRQMLTLDLPHISAYCLTVEPRTALADMVRKGKSPDVEETRAKEQYHLLVSALHQAGYEHYEVSNFAKPGYQSRHNGSYWLGLPYLGIGPSAHSFDGRKRWWNIANNALYIKSISNRELPRTEEILTSQNRFNEALLLGLRTRAGLDLIALQSDFGVDLPMRHGHFLTRCVEEGKAILNQEWLVLTDLGMWYADGIAGEMFMTDDTELSRSDSHV